MINIIIILLCGFLAGIGITVAVFKLNEEQEPYTDEILSKERFKETLRATLRDREETYSEIYDIIVIKRTYKAGRIELIRKRIDYT